jgi:hypothetical protein
MRDNLRSVFETKSWAAIGDAPRSGPGSDMAATARLRAALPGVFERYGVKTLFDAPCGDWFWMQHVDLSGITYIGADISGELIAENQSRFTAPNLGFRHLDITSDPLPQSDLMLCRDCLFHLKFWLRWKVLENFVASGSRYLMLTMHHVAVNNPVKVNGGFQRFNPMMAPFNFTAPIETIHETADQFASANHDHRSLGIWSRDQVVDALSRRITLAEETATPSG